MPRKSTKEEQPPAKVAVRRRRKKQEYAPIQEEEEAPASPAPAPIETEPTSTQVPSCLNTDEIFIFEMKNSLSSELCKNMIEMFENDPRKKEGWVGGGLLREIKQSTDLCFSNLSEWKTIDEQVFNTLSEGLNAYKNHCRNMYKSVFMFNDQQCDKVLWHFDSLIDTGYQIQKSKKGEFYHWHHDANDKDNRMFTFIWYLNTVQPEDGGRTEFICGKHFQPTEGTLVIFPATWTFIHRGTEVLGKEKYICTGWFVSR